MPHVTYFAYGSNMLTRRLRARAPSAEVHTVARLTGHVLRFHKRSTDGSGKCDAMFTGHETDDVFGIVFTLTRSDRVALDGHEGLGIGYRHEIVRVRSRTGESIEALTYLARREHTVPDLAPYHWYKELVVAGAREHGLPHSYVRPIMAVSSVPDPDRQRSVRHRVLISGR